MIPQPFLLSVGNRFKATIAPAHPRRAPYGIIKANKANPTGHFMRVRHNGSAARLTGRRQRASSRNTTTFLSYLPVSNDHRFVHIIQIKTGIAFLQHQDVIGQVDSCIPKWERNAAAPRDRHAGGVAHASGDRNTGTTAQASHDRVACRNPDEAGGQSTTRPGSDPIGNVDGSMTP
ncbi:hypothetical protein [Burkholderia ubonensis]|uniref:hypothetical protein n=1 Tax=Burkholderia ubonensis TaxID=101571 RepID=UPI0012FA475D|nr:hypothetical protein [Burkholderia ubonensis]